jgi:hypothetical protein
VVQDGDLRARNRSEHGCAGVGGGRRCAGRRSMWHSGPFPAISPASRRNAHAHMHAPRRCLVPNSSHSPRARSSGQAYSSTQPSSGWASSHPGGVARWQEPRRRRPQHQRLCRSQYDRQGVVRHDRLSSSTTASAASDICARLHPGESKPGSMRGECLATHQRAASIWVIIARAETGDGHLPAAHVSGHAEAHLPPKQVRAQ